MTAISPSGRSNTCRFSTPVCIAPLRTPTQQRQTLAVCRSIRSGVSTRLSVPPVCPTCPPLVLPDFPRRLPARRGVFFNPSLDGGFELLALSFPQLPSKLSDFHPQGGALRPPRFVLTPHPGDLSPKRLDQPDNLGRTTHPYFDSRRPSSCRAPSRGNPISHRTCGNSDWPLLGSYPFSPNQFKPYRTRTRLFRTMNDVVSPSTSGRSTISIKAHSASLAAHSILPRKDTRLSRTARQSNSVNASAAVPDFGGLWDQEETSLKPLRVKHLWRLDAAHLWRPETAIDVVAPKIIASDGQT